MDDLESEKNVTIHWFRHGLRLHDNPALLDGLENCDTFYAVFIFDGEVAGTRSAAFPRTQFLLETLHDLDLNLKKAGSRLYIFHGDTVEIFQNLFQEWGVTKLTFEQDPEPIWQDRDNNVKDLCDQKGVEWIERVSHMLFDPHDIIKKNGGSPPLTFAIFCQVAQIAGDPPRPVEYPDFRGKLLPVDENHDRLNGIPTPESLGVHAETEAQKSPYCRYLGGETKALALLDCRLEKEEKAFSMGQARPSQMYPDLTGMPLSLSPHLRFGSLSVRKFYWALCDAYTRIRPGQTIPVSITNQLIWREYFYCMSVNNPFYNKMKENRICLNIDWYHDEDKFEKWKQGQTGYPWIDACMRQLINEGWIHQVCRHATSCFLTRGDLWIDWQLGLEVFDRYLLDADWSVCAGNWMWVSSSAFEKVLQCPRCTCPVSFGRRMDPTGEYIRRYVPELKKMPKAYLFEPWKAPKNVQLEAGCIVGEDYPQPMVDHKAASNDCRARMERIKSLSTGIPHIAPTDEDEVMSYIWIKEASDCERMKKCSHKEAE